jgi:hypothetical protein
MEQHPVPQNVTNFEFKLIGDMTVRQFAYLAAGIIVGYLFYTLPWPDIIRFPIAFLCGFVGFAFAFMPIEERPLDKWFTNFIRSVYSPTQFLWKKSPQVPSFWEYQVPKFSSSKTLIPTGEMHQKLEEYLKTLPPKTQNLLDEMETKRLLSLNLGGTNQSPILMPQIPLIPNQTNIVKIHRLHARDEKGGIIFIQQQTKPSEVPKQDTFKREAPKPEAQKPEQPINPNITIGPGGIITKTQTTPLNQRPAAQITQQVVKKVEKQAVRSNLTDQNSELKKQIDELQKQINVLKTEPIPETMTGKEFDNKIKELVAKLSETEKQRQQTENELIRLRRKIGQDQENQPTIKPQAYQEVDTKQQPTAKYVSGKTAQQKGIPTLTTTPNVISGIVTDDLGNIIQDTIIIIKDKTDNPVRALKTNKVGQFMISTPLENGTYYLELEKEGYKFDIIEVELNGSVLSPLEIKPKTNI